MHSVLASRPNACWSENGPTINDPEIIGFFSIDAQRQCTINADKLKYINFLNHNYKKVNFDLNLGCNETVHKEDIIDEKISHLLYFLTVQERYLNLPFATSLSKSVFFCNRGLLSAICYTPYERNEPWRIVAALYKGDIYMCKILTDKYINDVKNMDEKNRLSTGWGHKFEQFLSSSSPNAEPNPNEVLNENEEFNVVFQRNINKHKLIFGAEMDGLLCDKHLKPLTDTSVPGVIDYLKSNKFIELKTNFSLNERRHIHTFRRFKTMKWWCQNYLVGVDKILCGFKNQNGIVNELKMYTLQNMLKHSENWDPKICLNFLDRFLTYVKECLALEIQMKHGDKTDFLKLPVIHLHFEHSPYGPVRVTDNYDWERDPILSKDFIRDYGKIRAMDPSSKSDKVLGEKLK